jgi:hypothetical protein
MTKKKKSSSVKSRSTSSMKRSQKSFLQQNYIIVGLIVLIGIVGFKFLTCSNSYNKITSSSESNYQTANSSPTEAMTPTRALANSNPQRNNCPEGFYYFENSTYSLCYPDKLTSYINNNVVDQATGKMDNRVIVISDDKAKSEISILPSFTAAGGKDNCVTTENVTVSGFPAVRETKKENVGNDCGKTVSIATKIQTGKALPFWILYQAYVGGELRFINDYSTIEQSLKIK